MSLFTKYGYPNLGFNGQSNIASLLAVAALLFGALTIVSHLSWSSLFLLGLISSIVFSVSLLLNRYCGNSYAMLFASSFLIRILLVLIISIFPPTQTVGAYELMSGVIYHDEAYYISNAFNAVRKGDFSSLSFLNAYERISYFYAFVFELGGTDYYWGRLVNAIVTSACSVVIFDTVRRSTGAKVERVAWMACAFIPELLLWSVTYLKEPLLTFSVALLLNGGVRLKASRVGFTPWLFIFFGVAGIVYCRVETLFLLLPILSMAWVDKWAPRYRHLIFWFCFIAASIFTVLLMFFIVDIAEVGGRESEFFERQAELSESGSVKFPFLEFVTSLNGPARSLGFTFLLLINPVITSVWKLISFSEDITWVDMGTAAYAVTWWAFLPFWIYSVIGCIKRRESWWLALASIYIVWIVISANMRFGAGSDAMRYREAYLPVLVLLSARGLEYMKESRRVWQSSLKYLQFYWTIVVLMIGMRGIGTLGM